MGGCSGFWWPTGLTTLGVYFLSFLKCLFIFPLYVGTGKSGKRGYFASVEKAHSGGLTFNLSGLIRETGAYIERTLKKT